MPLEVRTFDYPGRIEECFAVRRRVFIDEQDVTEDEEMDGLDAECVHVLALLDGVAVGAARLRSDSPGVGKAERVAVLADARGHGVGRALMTSLEEAARARGDREMLLGGQIRALPFYESLGYRAFGEEYLDARIRHRWMRKPL